MSVFDFLKQNSFSPFPERHIQDFAKSLLKSVDCESTTRSTRTELTIVLHRLKLVHTDLKPENILLVSNESRLAGPRVCPPSLGYCQSR
jgi:dual-specificity kinase